MTDWLYFNGIAPSSDGLSVLALTGWIDMPGIAYPTSPVINTNGLAVLSPGSTMSAREMLIGILVNTASTYAERRTLLNTFLRRVQGEVEFYTADDATKVCYGYLNSLQIVPIGSEFTNLKMIATIKFTCYDPLWYDPQFSSVSISALNTPVALSLGTASTPMFRMKHFIYGAGTNPTFKWKAASGALLGQQRFTITLAAADFLRTECQPGFQSITKSVSAVESDAFSTLNVLDGYPVLDPVDSPTVELAATGGAPTAVLFYRKPYLL